MIQAEPRLLITLALCPALLHLLCQRFDPQRLHGRVLTRCVTGLCLLIMWDLLLPLHLGVNPLSAWIVGTLGLPGLGLMAFLAQLA